MSDNSFAARLGLAAALSLATLAGACTEARAAEALLKPPFDVAAIRAESGAAPKKKFRCPAVPAPVASVEIESKYAAGSGSTVIDPARAAAYNAMSVKLRRFTAPLIRFANGYVRSDPADPRIARCVLSWLAAWARAGAVEQPPDQRGASVRAQVLAIASLAYVEIRGEPSLRAGERRAIEHWLQRLAKRVEADYSAAQNLPSRRNNHRYWAGWAVMAASFALNKRPMFDWAVASAEIGLESVTPDGFLPLEVERRQRALGYHFYAAEPLVMLAEGAIANGVDLYSVNDGAILRLAERTASGWRDPSAFAEKAGVKQDRSFVKNGGKVAWLVVLAQRFPHIDVAAWRARFRDFTSLAAGGDVELLYSMRARLAASQARN